MVFLCIASIVLSLIALHGIAWHCIAFDYLLWHCMVLDRLHSVVQLIWRCGELPRSASSHFVYIQFRYYTTFQKFLGICNPPTGIQV